MLVSSSTATSATSSELPPGLSATISHLRRAINEKERELDEVMRKYVDKCATAMRGPRLRTQTTRLIRARASGEGNGYEFEAIGRVFQVRLEDAKTANFSSHKKQCDLWEFVWGSSCLMASVAASQLRFARDDVEVLEMGGGLGLGSLAVRALHRDKLRRVVMTDLVRDALDVFEASARLNGFLTPSSSSSLSTRGNEIIQTKTLNWNRFREDGSLEEGEYDLVIASDVLFGNWCVAPVADAAAFALKGGGVLLLSDPCRLNDAAFVERLRESKEFGVENVRYYDFPKELIDGVFSRAFPTNETSDEVEDKKSPSASPAVRVFKARLVVARRRSRRSDDGEGEAIDFERLCEGLQTGMGLTEV